MTYMTKKTKKRQFAVVTLNDSNQAELNEVRQQRAQMMAEFETRKDGNMQTFIKHVTMNAAVRSLWYIFLSIFPVFDQFHAATVEIPRWLIYFLMIDWLELLALCKLCSSLSELKLYVGFLVIICPSMQFCLRWGSGEKFHCDLDPHWCESPEPLWLVTCTPWMALVVELNLTLANANFTSVEL